MSGARFKLVELFPVLEKRFRSEEFAITI